MPDVSELLFQSISDGVFTVDDSRIITLFNRAGGEVTGLEADDRVITHGHLRVRPGQTVNVMAVDDGSRSLPELLRSLPGGGRSE